MSAINLNNDLRDILERISGMCSKNRVNAESLFGWLYEAQDRFD